MSVTDSRTWSIAVYTLLRVGIFLLFWLPLQLLTPLRGVLAAAAALLMSGAVSLIVLDRQRNRVGSAAAGFFHGINERIEASARAEDDDEPGTPYDDAAPAEHHPQDRG